VRIPKVRSLGNEDGFTLIEALVACVILMVVSSAILGLVATSLHTTRNDKARVGASQLAARELDYLRQQFTFGTDADRTAIETATTEAPHNLDGSLDTTAAPISVNGVPYKVSVSVTPLVRGVGKSACDGGALVAHPEYLVTSTVTWPRSGLTANIVNSTVLTPPKSTAGTDTVGYLAVAVKNAAGEPPATQTVTISGPGGTYTPTTDATGCAVISTTQAGTYTVTLNTNKYVDQANNPISSSTAQVSLGSLTTLPMSYDLSTELDVTFSTTAGHALPLTLPSIALANTGIQPDGVKIMTAGVEYRPAAADLQRTATIATTSIPGLWPYATGYRVWAGSCTDSNPAVAPTNGSNTATISAPSAVTNVTVPLAPLDVVLTDNTGAAIANTDVVAKKSATGGCLAADLTLDLGTTDAAGQLAVSLPDGTWQVVASTASTNISIVGQPASINLVTP
jgi:type II secretory pathway pseudopilin PulG